MVAVGGVEPGDELHLLVADAVGVDVGVQRVGLPGLVPQELEVDLVVVLPDRRCLQCMHARQLDLASILLKKTKQMIDLGATMYLHSML